MKTALLSLCLAGFAFAGTQSLTPLINGTYPLANSSPFNSVGDNTLTIRIHNWTAPGSTQVPFCLPAGGNCLSINSSSFFVTQIFKDTMSGGGQPSVAIPGPDFIARMSRDTVHMLYTLEVFNPATGSCASASNSITSLGSNNWSGSGGSSGIFGSMTPSARVAYLRWSTVLPTTSCANMPLETDPTANLLDYEFEGNLTDTSPNAVVLTMTSPAYTTTPTYAPTCQGQDPVSGLFTANVISTNTSSSIVQVICTSESVGPSGLTYAWTKGTCPNSTLTNTSVAFPSLTITAFGQCLLNLSVADAVPNTAMVSITIGAVPTDAIGNVITGNATLDAVMGPMKRYGLSPWPYYDPTHMNWVQHIGNLQMTDPNYADQWNTHLSGTVTITTTLGVTTIVGSGTNFQTDFCSGGSSQAPNAIFIAWITDARAVGGTRRIPLGGSGLTCNSSTLITLSFPYNGTLGGAATGIQYALWNTANNWVGMSTNNNYYDNVQAFYNAYYRTGYTQFLTYARTMRDRWFTMPDFDQGLPDCNVDTCLMPRIVAFTGMAIGELDGRSDMLPGLDAWADSDIIHWNFYGDVRETAFILSVFALDAIIDAPGSHKTAMQAQTASFVSMVWAPQQLADGSFTTTLAGDALYVNQTFAPSASISGTVTASTGGAHPDQLVGSGTNFLDPSFLPSTCVFTTVCDVWLTPSNSSPAGSPPKDNTGGDNTTFHATVIDATHLQLDRAYDGILAGSGRGFQIGTQLGWGVQPFHMGVVAASMAYSYQALTGNHNTEATQAKGFAIAASKWIITTGNIGTYMGTAYNGLFYARNFANCQTYAQAIADVNCSQSLGDIQGIRYLNMEIMHGLSATYQISLDPVILAGGNLFYGAAYGCQGGPDSDAICMNGSLDPGSFEWTTNSAKTLGFSMGWGEGASWPAVMDLPTAVQNVSGAKIIFGAKQKH